MLSLANVYFFEPGLFNGLQPIQIKKSFPVSSSHARRLKRVLQSPVGRGVRSASEQMYSIDPVFRKEKALQKSIRGPERKRPPEGGLPRFEYRSAYAVLARTREPRRYPA